VSVIAVISQVLMPRADGKGVVAGFEVMIMTPAIENHIRKNETFKIPSAIQTGKHLGMFLLDDYLWDQYQNKVIDRQELLGHCQNPRAIREKLGIREDE
jgi:twitching motility protein PilT